MNQAHRPEPKPPTRIVLTGEDNKPHLYTEAESPRGGPGVLGWVVIAVFGWVIVGLLIYWLWPG